MYRRHVARILSHDATRENRTRIVTTHLLGCETVLRAIEFIDSAPVTCKVAAIYVRCIQPSGS
jgi:hypothetical protein